MDKIWIQLFFKNFENSNPLPPLWRGDETMNNPMNHPISYLLISITLSTHFLAKKIFPFQYSCFPTKWPNWLSPKSSLLYTTNVYQATFQHLYHLSWPSSEIPHIYSAKSQINKLTFLVMWLLVTLIFQFGICIFKSPNPVYAVSFINTFVFA